MASVSGYRTRIVSVCCAKGFMRYRFRGAWGALLEQVQVIATLLPRCHGSGRNGSWHLSRVILRTVRDRSRAFAATSESRRSERIRKRMIKVKMRGNETAEQMLRRFKKMCEKEGLTKDIKRIAYYEKPSEKRRRRQRKGPPRIGGRSGSGGGGGPSRR